MNIVELPEVGGFFKPKEMQEADALLIEVLQFEPNRPDKFKGTVDVIHANVTVFKGDGEPVVHPRLQINHNGLTRKLAGIVGNATIQKIGTRTTDKGHDAWVWVAPDAAAKAKVAEYVKGLEAAEADAPDFD